MRIPKTVTIVGREWQVKIDKKSQGGWFDTNKGCIVLGTKDYIKEETYQMFLHEVMEAVFANRDMRYKLPYSGTDNGNFLFNFNHSQFINAVNDIYLAIRRCLN